MGKRLREENVCKRKRDRVKGGEVERGTERDKGRKKQSDKREL